MTAPYRPLVNEPPEIIALRHENARLRRLVAFHIDRYWDERRTSSAAQCRLAFWYPMALGMMGLLALNILTPLVAAWWPAW